MDKIVQFSFIYTQSGAQSICYVHIEVTNFDNLLFQFAAACGLTYYGGAVMDKLP